ncbi:Stk1 family PASTA domain-containing Ser/Thr kinase [Nocardioides sp. ChNu-153]|uniref:Stk1 family PASTA domain-containing Ser/Thr kinase n=1 Tax=unclassified Nocardioides TaxID=2615069 RepID=UPI002404B4EA|nr:MULTISPECIES: Stk1 family PASTA domain-containing Ser/Thr kinase [unclassified Nocardioides]MDF9717084.1 Stk1 family PASTA domain-containing Ser/Thr kinase [Nocardioides sp. ChNu-99]MDN7121513.1 Stk1 family PASTA domain-containing Ser/Thr kinase [Nocardioides sp. ChNu-153]
MTDAESPTLVGGRYELGGLLGRGGMAEVRKGTDTRLGRVVAVKRLRTDLASDATFQARFRREAQSSASLNHPSIVAVYDTGEEMSPDGIAQPYIVMEFVAGRTLRDVLREGRKILPERALEITSGVLSALDYSHRAGIIHRDIKPGNVMLTPSGDVKVMDFGIARAVSEASSTMTQTAAVVGTAQYLSPEQARGETVDSRSDVYSAGCLVYELLTGRPPFVGDSPVAVAYQHVREQAARPSEIDPSLAPEIDQIVMKSLAKRVEDRYQSAAAMRSDIERYLAGRPVQAPAISDEPDEATGVPVGAVAAAPPTRRTPDEVEEERGPRKGPWVAAIAVLLALLVGVAVYVAATTDLFEDPPEDLRVPNVVSMAEDEARAELADAGFTVADQSRQENSDEPEGTVIAQDPPGDTYEPADTEVTLTVSSGPATIAIPDVVNDPFDRASAQLQDLGFTVRRQDVDNDAPADTVVAMEPQGGDGGMYDPTTTTVTLSVSRGPVAVPDVEGLQKGQAEQAIIEAGFRPEAVAQTDPSRAPGEVLRQIPVADGRTLPQDSPVVFFYNDYVAPATPPPTTTPPTTQPPTGEPTDPGLGGLLP